MNRRMEWFMVLIGPARIWIWLCALLCGIEVIAVNGEVEVSPSGQEDKNK